jgi:transcriptional regulator with XRE-family HTH domain
MPHVPSVGGTARAAYRLGGCEGDDMRRDSQRTDTRVPSESLADDEVAFDTSKPVDALVLECGGGRSVRQIERDAGVSQGNLHRYLGGSGSRRGTYPTLDTIETIAKALGTSVNRVSRALAEEAGIPELHAGDPPPAVTHDERQLLEHLRRMPQQYQALILHQVAAAAEWCAAQPEAGGAAT